MQIPTLNTERLTLRGFRADDLDSYASYCADARFMQFLMTGQPISREDTWRNMASTLGHWALRGYGVFAVARRADGQLLGFSGLLNPLGWPGPEVCWALGPGHWGQGYATEAVRAVIPWAFQQVDTAQLISLIHPDNHPSIALAQRVGEHFREDIQFMGKTFHVYQIPRPSPGGNPDDPT